jgi:DNA-binding transcriptional LysR family regulator
MAPLNLSIDLLRTFVTVIELGGFSRAGEALGRTQPAISLQMRRLESQLGTKLITTSGRTIAVTEEGKALAMHARRMLLLNDEVVARFSRQRLSGRLSVGLPTDYAVAFLQGVLTEYGLAHPEVRLEIHCDLSQRLLEDLRRDRLDIVIAMTGQGVTQYLAREWVERPIWAAARSWRPAESEPVPIVAHPPGCEYRNRMTEALNAAQRQWRIVYCSPGISGVQKAVAAGLGVSALTRRTLTEEMRILGDKDGFPQLADIRVGLFYKHPRQTDAGLLLVNDLITNLDAAGEAEFRRLRRR